MIRRWLYALASIYFIISLGNIIIHYEQFNGTVSGGKNDRTNTVPSIYIVTPTHLRYSQKADLIRLSQTLAHLSRLHWIVVEDSDSKSPWINEFLQRMASQLIGRNFRYTHLNALTPETYKIRPGTPKWKKPRGVWQRNEALKFLRDPGALPYEENGVVYFADDDNTYDLRLFEDIRSTKTVSIFPVGIVGGMMAEKPLVKDGKVVGFNAKFKPERTYPTDMAGFAVNLQLIRNKPLAVFSENVPIGYLETNFLEQIIDGRHQLEPKADDCKHVLVWHTRTKEPTLKLNKDEVLVEFNE